jgi:hypothetical protein
MPAAAITAWFGNIRTITRRLGAADGESQDALTEPTYMPSRPALSWDGVSVLTIKRRKATLA